MTGFFITGTDTDVGKTRITAALLRAFLDTGSKALAIKPIQTGCLETPDGLVAEDVEVYAQSVSPYFPDGYPDTCCVKYIPACSPHLAAELAGESIDLAALTQAIQNMSEGADCCLVEGAGGAAVPLGDDTTMLDLMRSLDLPVIVVADNKLGMINHTLMTVETIRNNGLTVAGVVVNNTTPMPPDDAVLRENNVKTIARHADINILADIPFTPEEDITAIARFLDHVPAQISPTSHTGDTDGIEFDKGHIWHPYTSALHPIPAVKVKRAHGTRLILEDNRELVDGMASWWCAIHGYANPTLDRALRTQQGRMSHVMFGGLTHDPAIDVCKTLIDMTPEGLEHVFLADSGSVSVEVAMKMALQYMQARGETDRTKLFTIRGGYHGDTCGAMSVCDPDNGMHHLFSGLLPKQIFAPRPDCAFHNEYDPASLDEAAGIMEAHSDTVAAIIVEPIVQGAGGMRFYHPAYLRGLRRLADEHDVLLILDEIATGFGRTGKMFACEWSDVTPDIMCVGKALSGGYMTLAATLATRDVARTISSGGGVLMHGPTFMGNPLACAVAKASLDLLAETDWQARVNNIEQWFERALAACAALPGVADVRVLGAIAVVEMNEPVNIPALQEFFIQRGIWLRPFGRLIYAMPPYIISQDEIARIGAAIHDAIAANIHTQD